MEESSKPVQNAQPSLLRPEHLVKRYGKRTVVNDVSFSVRQGEIVGLLGPNGAGKSTLIKVMAGLVKSDEGQRVVQKNTRIAYLPQSGLIHKGCTLREEGDKAFSFGYELMNELEEVGEKLKQGSGNEKSLLERHEQILTELEESGWNRRNVLLEQVSIPALISLKTPENFSAEEGFCYANCSVKYELNGNIFYKTYPLSVKYSENPEEIENSKNEIISRNAAIKNSANIFFFVEKLMGFDMGNQALAEINKQIAILEKIYETCPDRQLEVEIENLKMLKELVLKK